MANPNIFSTSSIIGDTVYTNAVTAATTIISGEASKVKKIGSIIAANYGTTDQTITIFISRAAVNYFITNQITVPARSTLLLLGREHSFYLLEDDVLRVNASAASAITVAISFETLS